MASCKRKLLSSDKQTFEVEDDVARQSQIIEALMEDTNREDVIKLPNVSGSILAKVVEYCEYHVNAKKRVDDKPVKSEEEIRSWDAEFIKVDQATLFDIILAANYLDCKPLLNLSCQTVAEVIKGKSPEEIRQTYDLVSDCEPEEDDQGSNPPAKVPRLETPEAQPEPDAEAPAVQAETSRAEGSKAEAAAAEGSVPGASGTEEPNAEAPAAAAEEAPGQKAP